MTVGQQLKQARLALQLQLKDIAKEHYIQSWVLEALEADQLHTTMSPAYVKNFLATYAKHLRLDPGPLTAQLYPVSAPVPSVNAVATNTPARPTRVSSFTSSRRTFLPVLLKVVMLARRTGPALALMGLVLFVLKAKPIPSRAIHLPRHEATLSVVPPVALPAEAAISLPTTQSLELVLIAHHPTWVLVKADGKLVAQQQLATGTQEKWTARKRFTLIVGAPAKTDILLNGQSINPLAMAYHGRLAITHQAIKPLDE